jgi:hypothetical protein
MLQNLKTNAHLIAKEKWYKWRCQLTTGVKQQIEAMNVNLKEVCHRLSFIPAIKLISLNISRTGQTTRRCYETTGCRFFAYSTRPSHGIAEGTRARKSLNRSCHPMRPGRTTRLEGSHQRTSVSFPRVVTSSCM